MINKLVQASILISITLFGCSSTKKLQNKGSVEPQVFYSKVDFTTYKSVIAIDVKHDGEVKTFLFDTGADLTLIQRDSLQGKTAKFSGASKRKMELGEEVVPIIEIGEAKFTNTYALNGNLAGLKEQIPNFGGLIGQPIISKANWLIDYPNRQLEVSSKDLIDDSFKEIEIVREGGAPYTFLEFNGEKYKVIIDFGSSSTVNLPEGSKFAQAVSEHIELSNNTRQRYTLGGLQETHEKVGVMPEVQLGDFKFENVDVNINTSSQPRIGVGFFSDFSIYIDNTNGGVYKIKRSSH